MTGALALGVCVCGGLLPCPCRHLLTHPFPVQDCGQCPQTVCRVCRKPHFECRDWLGHADQWRQTTTADLLAVTARAGAS